MMRIGWVLGAFMLVSAPALARAQGTFPDPPDPPPPDLTRIDPEGTSGLSDLTKIPDGELPGLLERFQSLENRLGKVIAARISAEIRRRQDGGIAVPSTPGGNAVPPGEPALAPVSTEPPGGGTPPVTTTGPANPPLAPANTPGAGTNWHENAILNLQRFYPQIVTDDGQKNGTGRRTIWDPLTGQLVDLYRHEAEVGLWQGAADELANTSSTGALRPIDR